MRWGFLLLLACASQRSAGGGYAQEAVTDVDAMASGRYDFKQQVGASWSAQLKFAPPRTPAESLGPLTEASLSGQGPSLAELVGVAHAQSKEHAVASVEASWWAKFKSRCGPGVLGWAALAFGAVAAALLAWRFRTGLASGVLRVLGRG